MPSHDINTSMELRLYSSYYSFIVLAKTILITWDPLFSLNLWIIIALIAVIKTLHATGNMIKRINYKYV